MFIICVQLYICWCDHETYSEVTKPRNGSVYPWPLNHIQTWTKRSNVIKRLKMLGWYEKTLTQVYKEVETCCQALTDRLEDKAYFFGDKYVLYLLHYLLLFLKMFLSIIIIRCSELDALVYGHIKSFLTFPIPAFNNGFPLLVGCYENLVEYCKRIDDLFGFTSDLKLKPYVSLLNNTLSSDEVFNSVRRTACSTKLTTNDIDINGDDDYSWDWDTLNEEYIDIEI